MSRKHGSEQEIQTSKVIISFLSVSEKGHHDPYSEGQVVYHGISLRMSLFGVSFLYLKTFFCLK